jgi:radical SAM-linked protein
MRLRLTFSKTAAMRFTGHMDLHRSLERTIRRARLPLAHTQGYNPRGRINLASALPLGVMGARELADIWLDEPVAPDEVLERINAAAPPGILLESVEEVEEGTPKLQKVVQASEFEVTLLDPIEDLDGRVEALLAAETVERERRGKAYDLRPLVLELRRETDDDEGRQRLYMKLLTQEGATGRADEVVAALGGDPLAIRATRLRIHLEESV